jgi:hypothetical protein
MKINIHATVSGNSLGYYRYMRANYLALTSTETQLQFFVYCLDPRSAQAMRQSGEQTVTEMAFGRGSGGHAKAIEEAIAHLVPGEINIIADTDVVLFQKGWDKTLADSMFGAAGYGMVGTRLEDTGGFSSGDIIYQQYKKKPTTTWLALSPKNDFSGLQVRPDKANQIEVTTEELAEIYQMPIGFVVVKDTGWQIPSFLHEHKIPYFALDIVKPTDMEAKALAGVNPYHDEFQWNGVPYLAHQRGSMKHRFRIDPLSIDFYDACDRYLGNPAWSVTASQQERAAARVQDVFRGAKRIVKTVLGRG